MKFAKELETDLVPEWRVKYLDYKAGKKKVKAVSKAVNRANATPRTPAQPNLPPQSRSIYGSTSPFPPRNKTPSTLQRFDGANEEPSQSLRESPAPLGADSESSSDSQIDPLTKTLPIRIPAHKPSSKAPEPAGTYGSFVPTPPKRTRSNTFQLPDPAVPPQTPVHPSTSGLALPAQNGGTSANARSSAQRSASVSDPQNAYEIGSTITPPHRMSTFATLRNRLPQGQEIRPALRRMFSVGAPLTTSQSRQLDRQRDVDMVALDHVKSKQKDFFAWMDKELDKVETFYKSKEDEAGSRLEILREQLHVMRNCRIQEMAVAQEQKRIRKEEERNIFDFQGRHSIGQSKKDDDLSPRPNSRDKLNAWFGPVDKIIGQAKGKVLGPHIGTNSKALQSMQASPQMRNKVDEQHRRTDEHRDYVRRPPGNEVPYRTAKRKLKLALQEFYRGLELLKSYSLLNRTAFRKINKKYDKAVDAHPPLRYMSEKVNKAYFVKSEGLDHHLHDVEDLYARYFERGNHKIATGKLRSSQGRKPDQSFNAFKNGLLIGVGAVFSVQGIVYGAALLHQPDPTIRTQTSYLLQIYGGYFLALYLFAWFCFDCSIWTRNKINYQFVFEFDPRHNLDWRQLSEFPSFLILLLGVFVWINFSRYGAPEMFIYYPVILIFVTAVIIFFPGPLFFHRSRRWFVYSHWRLLLAGLYPVEFRDFFLGDMYCSLTYFMSNIELFFCLYAHYWNNPPQCNSTHSRLLGFFSTLPGIWRALQCIRRYYDTRNVFPHLVNCGKYAMTIMYYTTLSMYRIDRSKTLLAVFSTFATVNAIYCSIWDLFMDWSLLQPNANKRLLRNVRGYRNPIFYYIAMVLDPILRFNWIFYSLYTHDLQHSSIVSFLVGFSEITRRGMWTLLRVENEHCSNVARFKASRDIPLPYELDGSSWGSLSPQQEHTRPDIAETVPISSPTLSRRRTHTSGRLEAQEPSEGMRQRAQTRTFTSILANAHTQDFEKKRKPGVGDSDNVANLKRDGSFDEDDDEVQAGSSDDDEDDEEDSEDVMDAEALLRQRRGESEDGER